MMKYITVTELASVLQSQEKYVLVDVRPAIDFNVAHIESAINIPNSEIMSQVSQLSEYDTIYLYCNTQNQSSYAYQLLEGVGFQNLAVVVGGITAWQLRKG